MKTKNLFRVNKRRWNQLSEVARHVFNSLYKQMCENPWVFQKEKVVKFATWKVTAWNMAWIAADEVMVAQKQQAELMANYVKLELDFDKEFQTVKSRTLKWYKQKKKHENQTNSTSCKQRQL